MGRTVLANRPSVPALAPGQKTKSVGTMPLHSPYYNDLKHRIFVDPVYLNIASADTGASNEAEAPWQQPSSVSVPLPFILASTLLPVLVIFTVVIAVSFMVQSRRNRLLGNEEDVELAREVKEKEYHYDIPFVQIEMVRADELRADHCGLGEKLDHCGAGSY